MTATTDNSFKLGDIQTNRPFKIRRLGHFGFYANDIEKSLKFYTDLLGFSISDPMAHGDMKAYFMRHGTDHHSFVLFNRPGASSPMRVKDGVTIQQITWQTQSLKEVVGAVEWFADIGQTIRRAGRDMPGSNWHVYPPDPDGHTNELYYGMEQIGWDGYSKPQAMYDRRFEEVPTLPQIPEYVEVQQAIAREVDVLSGYRYVPETPFNYDVDGVILRQPFKIVRHGPVGIFVEDMTKAKAFYQDVMGFVPTEEVTYQGETAAFLRCSTEHHSVALYPIALRAKLGMTPTTTTAAFGVQVANYRQLRNAVSFLRDNGVRVETDIVPPELHPGIDYAAYAFDPDGNPVMLYYGMEQIGWNGKPRPQAARRRQEAWPWPETIEPVSDTFLGEAFQGPWS